MADLVLGSTTAISETGGVLSFPPGHIVQIRYMTSDTGYSVSANTGGGWRDATAWDLAITPSSDSNKILYILCTALESRYTGTGGSPATIQITRNIGGAGYSALDNTIFGSGKQNDSNVRVGSTQTRMFVDSPATESVCVYRPQYATSTYTDTEAWFGNSAGMSTFDGTWAYAIEFRPST